MRKYITLMFYILLILPLEVFPGELVGAEAARERLYPNVVEPRLVFGRYGAGESEFLQIRKVIFDSEGKILVADCAANRIQQFDTNGKLEHTTSTSCPSDIGILGKFLVVFSEQEGRISLIDRKSKRLIRAWEVETVGPKRISTVAVNNKFIFAVPRYGGEIIMFDHYGRPFKHLRAPKFSWASSASVGGDVVYVTDKWGASVTKINYSTGDAGKFGTYGTYAGELANPDGITAYKDRVYIVDTVNHRVQRFMANGSFELQFGRHPVSPAESGNGRMHYPHNIAVSHDGKLIVVCEPYESRCNLFETEKVERDYLKSTESAWWNKFFYFHYRGSASSISKTALKFPADADYLFMGEEDIHRIVISKVIDGVPQTVTAFGEFGDGIGQFKGPEGVFAGPQGNLYVSDTGNNRIQVFDFNGNFKFQFGEAGSGNGQFNAPGQGSTDSEGNVYIADSGNGRVQVFDQNGKFLKSIGTPGTKNGQFLRPIDAHYDIKRKRLLVTDIYSKKITILNENGKVAKVIGGPGLGVGQFSAPHSAVVDPASGDILVSDMVTNSIQRFDTNGKFIRSIGSYGTALGEFKTPAGLAMLEGRLYVMDHTNHRGQVINPGTGKSLLAFGEGVIGFPGDTLLMKQKIDEISTKLKGLSSQSKDIKALQLEIDQMKLKFDKPINSK